MDYEYLAQKLGQQVKGMRQNRGLTQAALASASGVTRQKVIEIEKGSLTVSMQAYARVIGALGAELQLVPARMPTLEELEDLFK